MMSASEHILIIEDHNAIRILIKNYLSKYFKVMAVCNGYEAMAWMNKGNMPSVIVLDINMPHVDGIDFLKNIRNSGFFQHIPVIVVSGEEDGKIIEECIELGINGYLKKPFDPAELQTKILTILNKKKIKVVSN